MPWRKVLIVEDHDLSREALRILLTRLGVTVVAAGTLSEGLRKLDGQTHLILDLHLPDGHGTEIMRRVRDQGKLMQIAIVTGESGSAVLREAISLDPNFVCEKPLDFDRLLRWLESSGNEGIPQTAPPHA